MVWIPRKNVDEARRLHNDAAYRKFLDSDEKTINWQNGAPEDAGVGQFQAIDPFVPDGWTDDSGQPVGYNYNRALAVSANSPGYVNRDGAMRAAFIGNRLGRDSFTELSDMLDDLRTQGQDYLTDRWKDTRRRFEELFA